MKNISIILTLSAAMLISCSGKSGSKTGNDQNTTTVKTEEVSAGKTEGKTMRLTTAQFKSKVMNYEKNPKQWVFEGDKPCIVDFYADWCKPCKMIAPIMEELAAKYEGQINIYKVNVDEEKELANVFGINSIPYVMFVAMQGEPSVQRGALPKEEYEKIIKEFLLKKNQGNSKVDTNN
jgi:thioredoxin